MGDKTGVRSGADKMKKQVRAILLLGLVIGAPITATAGVGVSVSIALPPLIVFGAPPEMIVLPATDVYVVPDADVDLFFVGGWWWRPWEGRWYRSRYYDRGWAYRRGVPAFYSGIPAGWRNDYREHRWRGHQWNYRRVPHQQVQRNWKGWKESRRWEGRHGGAAQGLRDQPRRRQSPREVQRRQSRPQSRDVRPEQSRKLNQKARPQVGSQHQQTRPQSGKGQGQPGQRRGGRQERGKAEEKDRR